MAEEVEAKLEQAASNSPLPHKPDLDAIDRWVVGAYLRHWKERGLLSIGEGASQ
jgi:hypothetical protein